MTKSCSDFTDEVLQALGAAGLLREDDVPDDDPGRQSVMAVSVLQRLVEIKDLAAQLRDLVMAADVSESVKAAAERIDHAIASILPRYLMSDGYEHCFVGSDSTTTRWVMSLDDGEMVRAEYRSPMGWRALSQSEVKDLLEDIRDNGVRCWPENYDSETRDELPEWARV